MTPPPAHGEGHPASGDRFRLAGPHAVEIVHDEWHDSSRQRTVPVLIYLPQGIQQPAAVIVFSHGLGGSRDGYSFLGRHWASHGYAAVHLQHPGSDRAILTAGDDVKAAMRTAAVSPHHSIHRPQDIRFVLDRLESLVEGPGALAGRLDLARVAVAGHSFGAYTALAVAGQLYLDPQGTLHALADRRVKAVLAMSSPAPRRKEQLARLYAEIRVPAMHMTGTRDVSPIGLTGLEERRLPFEHIAGVEQYLVVFEGGDHMVFSDYRRRSDDAERDRRIQESIRMCSTAFWEAYLLDRPEARSWLRERLEGALAGVARLEMKS